MAHPGMAPQQDPMMMEALMEMRREPGPDLGPGAPGAPGLGMPPPPPAPGPPGMMMGAGPPPAAGGGGEIDQQVERMMLEQPDLVRSVLRSFLQSQGPPPGMPAPNEAQAGGTFPRAMGSGGGPQTGAGGGYGSY